MALYELTDNKIKYDWTLAGPKGMRVEIYPVKGRNSQADIKEAKAQLRRDMDVVYISVHWVSEEQWRYMKLWLHNVSKINDQLNAEYLEAYDNKQLEWQKKESTVNS